MHLKVLNLYEALLLLFHFFIGPCPVFYAYSPVILIFNFRINVLEAIQMAWEYLVFHFLRFL